MNIAVIPARGGSKRIPLKNIRSFCGRPIIAYSIQAALDSGLFEQILVSTDSQEIACIARNHSASVPFKRPQNLADDYCGVHPVVAHALTWCLAQGMRVEHVCLIYPTAPFIRATDIKRGLDLLLTSKASYALSVSTFQSPVQRALRINKRGRLEALNPENDRRRSQDLEETYHDAAQFCWGRASAFIEEIPLRSDDSAIPVPLPRHRVQDIDTLEDWDRAELMFEALNTNFDIELGGRHGGEIQN